MFKEIILEKYCSTASLDSGEARTRALKIWNKEDFKKLVRGHRQCFSYSGTCLQALESASKACVRRFNVTMRSFVGIRKVSGSNGRLTKVLDMIEIWEPELDTRPFSWKNVQSQQRTHKAHQLKIGGRTFKEESSFSIPIRYHRIYIIP